MTTYPSRMFDIWYAWGKIGTPRDWWLKAWEQLYVSGSFKEFSFCDYINNHRHELFINPVELLRTLVILVFMADHNRFEK